MKKYDLEMRLYGREDKISNEIIEIGRYTVQCAGVDIFLECEDKDGEYFITAYNENCECIDSKLVGLRTASKILAFEEEFWEKVRYLNIKESGLNKDICRAALSNPFIANF